MNETYARDARTKIEPPRSVADEDDDVLTHGLWCKQCLRHTVRIGWFER